MQAPIPHLILASGSATRAELMRAAGLVFETQTAAVDEDEIKAAARGDEMPAGETALLLATAKAQRIARLVPEALVIGADQMLECEGRWFDKPRDLAAARSQLQFLRRRTHRLETAVVAWRNGAQIWQHLSQPKLAMRDFSDDFLEMYLAVEGEKLLSSVGAYRLEGMGMHLFAKVDGEHSAVLGLPMFALLGFLRDHGVLPR